MLPTITAGIDVSSKSLECCVFNATTGQLSPVLRYANDASGIPALLAAVPADAPLIVEPTARYAHELIRRATDFKRKVLLAPNRQAKLFLRSENLRVKNDRIDSRGLARFGAQKVLRPYELKPDHVEHLDQLLSMRRQISGALTRMTQQRQSLTMITDPLDQVIKDLKKHLQATDKQIAKAIAEDPTITAAANRLSDIPGMGPVTIAAVISRLIAKPFVSADAFVAYCGMDITVDQSGESKGKGHLSKHGDAELRRLFYCCALATLRCKNNPFKEQYDREMDKGLDKTKVVCILARRLARMSWSIVAHGSTFDPSRIYKQTNLPKHDNNASASADRSA